MTLTMSPGVRRLALTVHLTCSIGWVGAVLAYIALGLAASYTADVDTLRAAWIAMDVTGWTAIVPLAIGALLTGILMSLGTPWGLFRHYWVLVSLFLTIVCIAVLLLHMPDVTAIANLQRAGVATTTGAPAVAAAGDHATHGGSHGGAQGGDLFHPTVGLILLLGVTGLNVYKPRGLTPYGWRKQQEERARLAVRTGSIV